MPPFDLADHLLISNSDRPAPTGAWLASSAKGDLASLPSDTALSNYPIQGEQDFGFLTIQFFAIIYLQKLALGPATFQLSVPMLIMLGSLAWRALSGTLAFSQGRLAIYLCFVGLSFASQMLLPAFSVSSLLELIVLMSFFTIQTTLSETVYRRVLNRYVQFMVLPACIVIFQYGFQKLTGLPNPLNMNRMLPPQLLAQGYLYEEAAKIGFAFTRPNGFFFLEPSSASLAVATALITEVTFFRRPSMMILMLLAMVLTLGSTGITMLVIATPFLLAREKPHVIVLALVVMFVALSLAYAFDVPLPLISRVNELNATNTSGTERLLIPLRRLFALLADPPHWLIGQGAGGLSSEAGSFWPIVKLLSEYGLPVMATYVVLYAMGLASRFNIPLKIALSVVFNFTGGYLLQPVILEYIALFCFIIRPAPLADEAKLSEGKWRFLRRSGT